MRKTIVLPVQGDTVFDRGAPGTPPSAPTILSVTPSDEKNVIAWTAVPDITEYRLYYSTSPGVDYTDNKFEGITDLTYEHVGLLNGTTYYYKVSAIGPGGQSVLSNEKSGTPSTFVNTYSMNLDGTEYLAGPDVFNFERTDSFSAFSWIKTSIAAKGIINRYDGTTGWALYMSGTGKGLVLLANDNTIRLLRYGNTVLTDGAWHLVGFTYDGSSSLTGLKLYLDGALDNATGGTDNLNASIQQATYNFEIGILKNYSNYRFIGKLEEPHVWGKELSLVEIQQIYNNGVPNKVDNLGISDLEAWYRMGDYPNDDDQALGTVYDQTTNSYDLTCTYTNGDEFNTDVPT